MGSNFHFEQLFALTMKSINGTYTISDKKNLLAFIETLLVFFCCSVLYSFSVQQTTDLRLAVWQVKAMLIIDELR